ncbi:MAG: DUF1361 domain-containing protein [Anaerolineae bacterium]|nr:DUF1361 domain-containing protein [Anaerolineae bacterium]
MMISSLLAIVLLAGRFYLSRSWTYYFLLWNLTLAWVPYIASICAYAVHHEYPKRWLLIIVLAGISILFFPNAPYIVTDFLHLTARWPVPLWYDTGLLAAFSWAGLLLGVYALRLLHTILEDWLGKIAGWFFVLCVVNLSGFGIYLGRFLRWNSWDLVTNPRALLLDIAVRLRYPLDNKQAYGVALLFAALLFSCYTALYGFPRQTEKAKIHTSL